jgi:hypothetical protein
LPIGFVVCASACRTPPTVSLAIIPAAMPATKPPVTKSRRETPSSVDVVLGVSSATVCWHCSLCWGTKYSLSHPDCIRHPPPREALPSLCGGIISHAGKRLQSSSGGPGESLPGRPLPRCAILVPMKHNTSDNTSRRVRALERLQIHRRPDAQTRHTGQGVRHARWLRPRLSEPWQRSPRR